MASTGDFLSGLLRGAGQGFADNRKRKDALDEKELRKKVLKAQAKAAEAAIDAEGATANANRNLGFLQQGSPAIPGGMDPGSPPELDPPSPATPGMGISEILASKDPAVQSMLLQLAPEKLTGIASLLKLQQPAEREQARDPRGVLRFTDTSEPVFPGVRPPPLSKKGKEADDLLRATEKFGANSPQVQALQSLTAGPGAKPPDFGDVSSLRKEFTKGSQGASISLGAFDALSELSQNPTGAGDIGMIFQFMKLLDPGSRVTDSEVGLASEVSGAASKVLNLYNRLVKGERLTPRARQDILFQAANIARTKIAKQRRNEDQFRGIATRNKIDERDVIIDFVGETEAKTQGIAAPTSTLDETIKKTEATGLIGRAIDAVKTLINGAPADSLSLDQIAEISAGNYKGLNPEQLDAVIARLDAMKGAANASDR